MTKSAKNVIHSGVKKMVFDENYTIPKMVKDTV
jgi:hypothetical protein